MNKIVKNLVVTSFLGLSLNATGIEDIKNILTGNDYDISGAFSSYDFIDGVNNGAKEFDWAFSFLDENGEPNLKKTYQLQGKKASDNDVFGWKPVTINTDLTPAYYMFSVDIDGNNKIDKFDWILISPKNNGSVYKLMGVNNKGNFTYSAKINIGYTIDNKKITFNSDNIDEIPQPTDLDLDELPPSPF